MKKRILASTLSIKKMCPMPWDTMPRAGVGRYCDSCNKIVLDLTDCTEAEADVILARNTKPCVRIKRSTSTGQAVYRAAAATLLAYGPHAAAQSRPVAPPVDEAGVSDAVESVPEVHQEPTSDVVVEPVEELGGALPDHEDEAEDSESGFSGRVAAGVAFDTHGDFGGLLYLRLAHRFALAQDWHLTVGGSAMPMVIPSSSDAHNRVGMGLGPSIGVDFHPRGRGFQQGGRGVGGSLQLTAGLFAGATQATKLGAGPYVEANATFDIPISENAWIMAGPSVALVYATFDTAPVTLVSLMVGLGWR